MRDHPNAWLRQAEEHLGLEVGSRRAEPEFHAAVQKPDGPVSVLLASFETIDPPFAEAEALVGRFIAITEARASTPAEMALLGRAYTVIMG